MPKKSLQLFDHSLLHYHIRVGILKFCGFDPLSFIPLKILLEDPFVLLSLVTMSVQVGVNVAALGLNLLPARFRISLGFLLQRKSGLLWGLASLSAFLDVKSHALVKCFLWFLLLRDELRLVRILNLMF